MAVIANTYTAWDAKGIREDLSDVIYRISPTETPFMSSVGKGSCEQQYFEWQNDALAAPNLANAQIDGNDYTTFAAVTPTQRLGNYTQISAKQVLVSGRLDRVKKAGRKSETAYQLAMRAAELKRDMESILCQNQAVTVGSDTVAGTTAGFESFMYDNVARGTGGANPTLSGGTAGYPNAAPTDGTARAFTETLLKGVLAAVWQAGGHNKVCMVDGVQKQTVSTFSGIATLRHETGNNMTRIIGAADLYVSDFGEVQIVPNRFSRHRSALLFDPDFIEVVYLRPFQQSELAKTGDASKRLLIVDYGLKVNHAGACGIVADLT